MSSTAASPVITVDELLQHWLGQRRLTRRVLRESLDYALGAARMWDESTDEINRLWPTIPPHRLQEVDTAFIAAIALASTVWLSKCCMHKRILYAMTTN